MVPTMTRVKRGQEEFRSKNRFIYNFYYKKTITYIRIVKAI